MKAEWVPSLGSQELTRVTLSDYIGKKYVILFFYPLDFTFVCPTGWFQPSRPPPGRRRRRRREGGLTE